MKKITDTVERFLSFIVGVGLICFFSFILLLASAQLNNSRLGILLASVAGETARTARTESFSYWGRVGQEVASGLGITGIQPLSTAVVNPAYTPVVVVAATNTPAPTPPPGATAAPAPTATAVPPTSYIRSSALSEGGRLLWNGEDANGKLLASGVNLQTLQNQYTLALAQNPGDLLALWLKQRVDACTPNYNLMVTTPYSDTTKASVTKAAATALLKECNPRLLMAYAYIRWADIALWLAQAPLDQNSGLPRPADETPAVSLLSGLTVMLGEKDGAARGFRAEDRVRVDVLPLPEYGLSSISMQLSVATLDQILGAGNWKVSDTSAYAVPGSIYPTVTPDLPVQPTDAELTPPQVATTGGGGAAPQSGGATTYTVQSGDTANSIARQFNITLEALIAANPTTLGVNPNLLQVGDLLTIPAP